LSISHGATALVVGEELLALDLGEIGRDAFARAVETPVITGSASNSSIACSRVAATAVRRAFSDGAGVRAALDPVDAGTSAAAHGQIRVRRTSPPRSSIARQSGTRM